MRIPRALAAAGLPLTGILVTLGTYWAFERGGRDFNVFYEAWRLVLSGHGMEVYSRSPDRFLYAPGFAWLLSPLALLPRELAMALWSFGKAGAIGYVVRELARRLDPAGFEEDPIPAAGAAALGVLLLARPFLVDFQYGQVNTYILAICAWALLSHFQRDRPGALRDGLPWFLAGAAAVTKVFPLPMLLVPFLVTQGVPGRRLGIERMAAVAGVIAILAAPALTVGLGGAWSLLFEWRLALIARSLPPESHNQSFAALLHHYLSGEPTHVIAEGTEPVRLGWALLSTRTIDLLTLAWTSIWSGIILAWIFGASSRAPLAWLSVLMGLLIVPSHLVWKPYFVMGLPLAVLLVHRLERHWALALAVFVAVNFTGFDFLGHAWGARAEALSLLLLAHLAMVWAIGSAPAP